jgi:uncharacterized membrane protein YfcA
MMPRMPDAAGWLVLVAGALVGSVVGGVAGFGGGIVLLPLIAWVLDVRMTVPVLTVAMALGNLSRIWWSRREVDAPLAAAYLAGAVPATVLGAVVYAGTPTEWLGRIIGAFLLLAVPLRRLVRGRLRPRLAHFPALGGAVGLLSALVVTTGPVVTPFFLAYGLRRGAYIATEALCAMGMHLTRGAALARYALLTWEAVVVGLVLGATMFAGSWLGRRLLDRMSERVFLVAVEALLVVLGLHFLLVPR